jgi:hypothetical protein
MVEQILLFLTMAVAAVAQMSAPLLTDGTLVQLALEVLEEAGAADGMEHAAFIVQSSAGVFGLMAWPNRGFYGAKWTGPIPKNAVAVIHTHPRQRPIPSSQDRAEASRLGLPFYVVSRAALCVATPAKKVLCADRIPWLIRGGIAEAALMTWTERALGTS